jgi:glycosyltransferase involved in cell wall biosynthesis
MVDAFSAAGMQGRVIVPYDCKESLRDQQGRFEIERYRYGILSRGRLAFGAGIIPNLRKSPLLHLQIPMLLLVMLWRAISARSVTDVYHANWVVSGLVARFTSLLTGKPYVITLRGEDVRLLKKRILGSPFRWALQHASAITSVNKSFLDEVATFHKIGKDHLHFIPNGVLLAQPGAEAAQAAKDIREKISGHQTLIFIGTVIPRKGVHTLLQILTFPQLAECGLIICGRLKDHEYFESLTAQLSSQGLENRVHFAGPVAPDSVLPLLRTADIYISASEHEGRSNAVLEAMSAGLPCFLSDIPGHREVLESSDAGVLFSLDKLEEAAISIRDLLADEKKRETLSKNGIERASQFSWKNSAALYKSVFQKAV